MSPSSYLIRCFLDDRSAITSLLGHLFTVSVCLSCPSLWLLLPPPWPTHGTRRLNGDGDAGGEVGEHVGGHVCLDNRGPGWFLLTWPQDIAVSNMSMGRWTLMRALHYTQLHPSSYSTLQFIPVRTLAQIYQSPSLPLNKKVNSLHNS